LKKFALAIGSLLILSSVTPVLAESQEDSAMQLMKKMSEIKQSVKKGNVTLPNGIAELKLDKKINYIPPQSAEIMLVDLWGNEPGSGTHSQGMLIPSGVDVSSDQSWGVVITYEEDGHVSDEDAAKIDYDDLMKQMKESVKEAADSEDRDVELVGWADKPYYDQATHKMYWAKDIKFNKEPVDTLNYNVRILGRKGVLVLNAVSDMKHLDSIKTSMSSILGFTDFTAGNKYTDFNKSTDKLAQYGLAALILGGVGVAAKTGLLAKLFVLLLAFKKVLIIGVIAIGAFFQKMFSKKPA
jgi:uncharacterized membrane-anchored protein